MIAIVGSPAELICWAERGLSLAEPSADPRAGALVCPLLHNLGVSLGEQGPLGRGIAVHEQSVAWRAGRGLAKSLRSKGGSPGYGCGWHGLGGGGCGQRWRDVFLTLRYKIALY